MIKFTVRGRNVFPLDMLRRDCCWPERSADAAAMNEGGVRDISLVSTKRAIDLTRKRWESFGWFILETDGQLDARQAADKTKIWLLEAENTEVPGRIVRAFPSYEAASRYEVKLRDEHGDEIEYIDISELEVGA